MMKKELSANADSNRFQKTANRGGLLTALTLIVLTSLFGANVLAQDKGESKDKKKATDEEKTEKREIPTCAEKISGKVVITNAEGLDIDFSNAEFALEEKFDPAPPKLPKDWNDKTPAEQQAWAQEFLASPAGVAYKKQQEAEFEKRAILEIIVDDKGEFELKDVPFDDYLLQGRITATKGDRKYAADIYAAIEVNEDVDHVDLGEIEVEVFPFLAAGDAVPDVELEPLAGDKKISLKDLRGKYVLLDFWATWCRPCIEATPSVVEAYEEFAKSEKLVVVGITQDDEKETAQEYVKKKELPWMQAFAGEGHEQVITEFGIQGIPSFWLIDPKGIIVANPEDFFKANLDIKRVLKEKIK